MKYDPVVDRIIGAAIKVHRALGPGLLESSYETCLEYELKRCGLGTRRQVAIPLVYEDIHLDCGYRVDLIVADEVIVEVKSVEALKPIHSAQVITYLRLTKARHALLFNFNEVTLKKGLRSFVGHWVADARHELNPDNSG
jgi:GxxExxY protein